MFEDDGKTYGSIGWSVFEYLRFEAFHPNEKYLKIEMLRDGWDYDGMPKKRIMTLELVNQSPSLKHQIKINGKKTKAKNKKEVMPYYTFEKNYLVIVFEWDGSFTNIEISQ